MANQITQEEAREALVDFVSENSCWGLKPALQIQSNQIMATPVYRYELDSFIEHRKTFLKSEPYEGGEVDGPRSGPAVQAWDIGATPNEMFKNEKQHFVVPHTSSIKNCSGWLSRQERIQMRWMSR